MTTKHPTRITCAVMARVCAALLALGSLAAHATVLQFCVTTQAQLDSALQSAALLSFIPHVIHVKTGSYQLHNPIDPVSYVYYRQSRLPRCNFWAATTPTARSATSTL